VKLGILEDEANKHPK